MTSIIQKLSDLKAPETDSPKHEREVFTKTIETIRQEFRILAGLHLLELTDEDKKLPYSEGNSEILINYYNASRLLTDCLKLAIVTNCESIINQLFLPTEQSKT